MTKKTGPNTALEPVAGNGLLHRRLFLTQSAATLGGLALLAARPGNADPLEVPGWMKAPGTNMSPYGQRSQYEDKDSRVVGGAPGVIGNGVSLTPHQSLHGTITPNSLHFERHHSGVPDIDPAGHRFLIHGLVKRPLVFTMDALARYPTVTRIQFLECAGNSGNNSAPMPPQAPVRRAARTDVVQRMDRRAACRSCSRKRASTRARSGLLAEGADAAAMSRSIPLEKLCDDAIIALYQNGERLRPENGYPMRLFLPGWEGNMNGEVAATAEDRHGADDDARRDVALHRRAAGRQGARVHVSDGREVGDHESVDRAEHAGRRSCIEITGLAWSGAGKIARVEVSADGGKTWARGGATEPVLSKAFTRFGWRGAGTADRPCSRAARSTSTARFSQRARAWLRGSASGATTT